MRLIERSYWLKQLRWWLLWSRFGLHRPVELMVMGQRLSRGEIGRLGERLAAQWLRTRGRKVLYRNFRGPFRGEVDIVARHGQVLTFVEVKTRTSTAFGRPADAVTRDKQRLIRRGGLEWLRQLGNPKIRSRFDIVEVLLIGGAPPQFHVIENAFEMPDSSMVGR